MDEICRVGDRIRIPKRAESDGLVGDGMVEIGPEDDGFDQWDKYIKDRESRRSMPSKSREQSED